MNINNYSEKEVSVYLSLKRYSHAFALITIVSGFLVLLGWQFDIPILYRPFEGSVVMKPVTAVLFILSGTSLWVILEKEQRLRFLLPARIVSWIVVFVGIARVLEIAIGFNSGIGSILYPEKLPHSPNDQTLNFLSLNTAIIFILLGLIIFSLSFNSRRLRRLSNFTIFLIFTIGLFSFIGYIYGGEEFYEILSYFPISVYTSTLFILLASSLLFYNSTEGFMKTFANPYLGGIISRIMIVPIILIPVLFGFVWLYLIKRGTYSYELNIASLITVIIVVFFLFIWYLSTELNKADAVRNEALNRISFLASITENIQDPIITTDTDFLISDWNEAAEHLFGWKKEEVLGRHPQEILHTIFLGQQREAVLYQFDQKGYWRGEAQEHTKDGRQIFVQLTSSKIFENTEKKEGHIGNISLVRDITLRVKAEEALKKLNDELEQKVRERTAELDRNEKRFRAMVENNHGIITLLNRDMQSVFRSPGAIKITGYTDEERANHSPVNDIHPDDKSQFLSLVEKAMEEEGQSFSFTVRAFHKNGKLIWLEGTITSLLSDPNIQAVIFNFHDITRLKEIQEELENSRLRLQLSLDTANIGLYDGDFIHGTAWWDKRVYEFWGIPEGTTVKPMDFLKQVHPDDLEKVERSIQKLFSPDSDGRSHEQYRIINAKNGAIRWMDMNGELLYQNGQPFKYIGTAMDITLHKLAEEELRLLNEQMRELSAHLEYIREEERTHIAREIHDELGQQLTGLKLAIAWIRNNIREDQDKLNRHLDEMMEMVNTSIQSIRKIIVELRPGILDDLGLEAALEWQSKEFETNTGISFTFVSELQDTELPRNVVTTVFRIFQESLTNIAKHSGASKAYAYLYTEEGRLILEINDNGKSISLENKEKPGKFGIMGMKERAAMLKGSLTVQPLPGGGTGVTMIIPLHS